jgi:hypothetical protein
MKKRVRQGVQKRYVIVNKRRAQAKLSPAATYWNSFACNGFYSVAA